MFLGMHPSNQIHNQSKMRPTFSVNETPICVGLMGCPSSDNHRISHLLGPAVRGDPRQLGLGLRGRQGEHCARGHPPRGLCPRLREPGPTDGAT